MVHAKKNNPRGKMKSSIIFLSLILMAACAGHHGSKRFDRSEFFPSKPSPVEPPSAVSEAPSPSDTPIPEAAPFIPEAPAEVSVNKEKSGWIW